MLEIRLKEEYDEWLRKISREVRISPEELAYMSIEKFIKEYFFFSTKFPFSLKKKKCNNKQV
ncbi:MAG: hypothetical protein WA977_11345 [Halobacteriota archaeon]